MHEPRYHYVSLCWFNWEYYIIITKYRSYILNINNVQGLSGKIIAYCYVAIQIVVIPEMPHKF